MKLATLSSGARDGQLVVVSQDLELAVQVEKVAPTLQCALDDWQSIKAELEGISDALNNRALHEAFPFSQEKAHSPLPRAYHWADGSAYVNHVELVRKARGAEIPANFWTDPLMYQGGSDCFLSPRSSVAIENLEWGVDFEAEVAVITNDVPMACQAEDAMEHIALVMLVNDWSLRNLIPNELGKGFGFYQSKPSTSFSPVAVTPDELGGSWDGKKVHLPLQTQLNGHMFGEPNAGVDMTFDFAQLIAHAARTRPLAAGTIIGSGTVSNLDRSKGSSCLAEKRMLEIIESGSAETPFMQYGDKVRIEMLQEGRSVFGAIEQEIVPL